MVVTKLNFACEQQWHLAKVNKCQIRKKLKCSSDIVSMCDRFTLPGRGDAVVELWRSKMEEGVLAPAHFLDHWRVTVPRIYSPQPNRTCLGEFFKLYNYESRLTLLTHISLPSSTFIECWLCVPWYEYRRNIYCLYKIKIPIFFYWIVDVDFNQLCTM